MHMPAGAWVIVYYPRKGLFLLAKRSGRVNNPHRWNLFGGQLDPGESPIQAALRELKEESGIRASKRELLKIKTRRIRYSRSCGGFRHLHFYLLTAEKELRPTLNREHSKYAWFRAKAIPSSINRPTEIALRDGLLAKSMALATD